MLQIGISLIVFSIFRFILKLLILKKSYKERNKKDLI